MKRIYHEKERKMQARKIDNIFKSKLIHHDSEVSGEAWGKMENLMSQKKGAVVRSIYWKLAAACVIVLISTLTFYAVLDNVPAETTAQVPSLEPRFTKKLVPLEKKKLAEKSQALVIPKKLEIKPLTTKKTVVQSVEVINRSVNDQVLENRIEEAVLPFNVEDSIHEKKEEPVLEPKPKKRLPVRITYKRGNLPQSTEGYIIAENDSDTVRSGKIKQFLQNTKQDLEQSALWADVKSVKEKLIDNKRNENQD